MKSCQGCTTPFTPEPWVPGWTDIYCPTCQSDAYTTMGQVFRDTMLRKIADAQTAAGFVPPPGGILPPDDEVKPETNPVPTFVGLMIFASVPIILWHEWLGFAVLFVAVCIAFITATEPSHD